MFVKYGALHFYLSLSSSRRMARIVMDSGEGMWYKRVVANCDGHESKMKEKEAAFHNLLPHGWADHVSTISKNPLLHGEVQCPERVITQTKLSNSKSYLLAVGSEDKSCCDLGRPGRCWKLQQKLSNTKVCEPTVLFQSVRWIRSSERCCGFPKRRVNDAEHHNFLHTHRASLYANVGLLMILADVPMQTSICVMDEVAKLFEHVVIDIPNSSTGTLTVTVPATVPGPVGNIRHEGLDGSR